MDYNIVLIGGPGGDETYVKNANVEGKACRLEITATPGQDEYWVTRYIEPADGIMVVYSTISGRSFEEVTKLRNAVLCIRVKEGVPDIPIMLVGTKCDFSHYPREVSYEQGNEMAAFWKTFFFETSAKSRENVVEAFHRMVKMIDMWRMAHPNQSPAPPRPVSTPKNLVAF